MIMKINALLLAFGLILPAASQDEKVENDARFHPALLTAAKNHEAYTKVDDVARFAPALCLEPPPPSVRISGSKDESSVTSTSW